MRDRHLKFYEVRDNLKFAGIVAYDPLHFQPRVTEFAATWRAKAPVQCCPGIAPGDLQRGPGICRWRSIARPYLGPRQSPIYRDSLAAPAHPGRVTCRWRWVRRLRPLRCRWCGMAGDQAVALAPRGKAVAAEDAPDPSVDRVMALQLGPASSAAIRAGPNPGWPRATTNRSYGSVHR